MPCLRVAVVLESWRNKVKALPGLPGQRTPKSFASLWSAAARRLGAAFARRNEYQFAIGNWQ
jgi:hypothetical protein